MRPGGGCRILGGGIIAACLAAPPLRGQEVPRFDLEGGDRFVGAFSSLNGARELSDGRLVVSDWIEERVAILSFDTDQVLPIGHTGGGPGEFRLPGGLLPFRGDSTLLIDLGNQRLSIVGPVGEIHRVVSVTVPGAGAPGGLDRAGQLYFVQPGWATGAPPTSRAPRPLVRWGPEAGEPVEIGRLDVARPRSDAGQPRMTPGLPFVPFAARDGWAVGLDGTVALVRWDPYHVEWIGTSRWTTPPIAAESPPVTAAERRAFIEEFLERTPVSGRGPGGGLGHAPTASPDDVARLVETNEFADQHGPFDPASIHLSPGGALGVGRTPPTRSPAVFDVFEPLGDRHAQVALPTGRRLLAVGSRHVYAVSRDDLGLETLERYELPAALSP